MYRDDLAAAQARAETLEAENRKLKEIRSGKKEPSLTRKPLKRISKYSSAILTALWDWARDYHEPLIVLCVLSAVLGLFWLAAKHADEIRDNRARNAERYCIKYVKDVLKAVPSEIDSGLWIVTCYTSDGVKKVGYVTSEFIHSTNDKP